MFYIDSMSAAKTVSFNLPPDLLIQAEECAQREHRTLNDLVGRALEHYIAKDPEWEDVLTHTRAAGRRLGIAGEDDIERLSDEFRREKQL